MQLVQLGLNYSVELWWNGGTGDLGISRRARTTVGAVKRGLNLLERHDGEPKTTVTAESTVAAALPQVNCPSVSCATFALVTECADRL